MLILSHVLLPLVLADPRLFADLQPEELKPKDGEWCAQQPISECSSELHTGVFNGFQYHAKSDLTRRLEAEAAEKTAGYSVAKPGEKLHYRLLLLITTVWRNFQRRQLLRNSLIWCRRGIPPADGLVAWRFLLGDVPPRLRPLAAKEAAKHDDMQLLGGPDEIDYRHVGDAYRLKESNPELLKLIVSFRRLRKELTYDYVLVADDDSFVSLKNALDFTYLLPKEKVYVGNLIDTIPQRFVEGRGLMQEQGVSYYMGYKGSSSKLPVFAHGMGFILSGDVAMVLADVGLHFKLRGNDDMLLGLWLRSIEGLHYLQFAPMFHDHAGFGGTFAMDCTETVVVVHRMTQERWRTFSRFGCHICGEDADHEMALEELKSPAEDLPASPSDFEPSPPRNRKLRLAILIFGSRWSQSKLRGHLRQSLHCGGADTVAWRFVMGRQPLGDAEVVEELLRYRDMTALRYQADGSYAYEDAWNLVEEHFGHADFLLLLDHRAFVNVKVVLQLLDQLPSQRVVQGHLLDIASFDGDPDSRGFLWRRRAPSFPHGMGFVLSNDVAKLMGDMSQRLPLTQAQTPVDVALGFWLQVFEDMSLTHDSEHFHELPLRSKLYGSPRRTKIQLRQNLSGLTAVAWPMSPASWSRSFDATQCQVPAADSQHSDTAAQAAAECWNGMPEIVARPEPWYAPCCTTGWNACWNGDFTAERCCPFPPRAPLPDPPLGLEALEKFLNFSSSEVQLFLAALNVSFSDGAEAAGAKAALRSPCLAPDHCAKEAFARIYVGFWQQKLLPLRHPWTTNFETDPMAIATLVLRESNKGRLPRGHEHVLERIQVAHFLDKVKRRLEDPSFLWPKSKPRRCLEWDSGRQSRYFFGEFCQVTDVVTYTGTGVAKRQPEGAPKDNEKINYLVDIHIADRVVPENSTSMVVCSQVFEHLEQPFVAMQQIFRLLTPGGLLAFTVPLFSEIHGSPQDYWRYTPEGAKLLATSAGLEVLEVYGAGSLRETAGYLLGMNSHYWPEEDYAELRRDGWPLQVYMLARKPW